MENHNETTTGAGISAAQIAYFNRFEIELSADCVRECYHQGACDNDVENWRKLVNLSALSDSDLVAELAEYGAWNEEELQSREENERRILWIAAGNIAEEMSHE